MNHIKYKSGYKYQLNESYTQYTYIYPDEDIETQFIRLDRSGVLTIRKGYAWDGPSWAVDTKSFMRGSLVHDALYQLFRHGLISPYMYKETIDRLLQTLCIEDGMFKIRAWWVYKGVKLGGWKSVRKRDIREIKTAP